MNLLSEMESSLDEVKARAEEGRQAFVASAQDEGARATKAILQEASRISEQKLRRIEAKAEEEARKVLLKADARVEGLKKKTATAFDGSVEIVLKALLALD